MGYGSSSARWSMKLGARIALVCLLATVILPVGMMSAEGADVNPYAIPGAPITPSPIKGTMLYGPGHEMELGVAYSVFLKEGQSITVALKGPDSTDFGLYLFSPGTTNVYSHTGLYYADESGSVELLDCVAKTTGTFYLWVQNGRAPGPYTLTWRVEDEVPGLSVTPVEGMGRIETAIMSARTMFRGTGSDYVIVATALSFPDALGGSALAGVLDAPILLTNPAVLPEAVATEIVEGLAASKVIILGGNDAVSQEVEKRLRGLSGVISVERVDGANRYETSENIASRVIKESSISEPGRHIAFVATGAGFPDALAASSAGAQKKIPFFLTNPSARSSNLVAALNRASINEVIILGGTSVVSQAVENAIKDAGITIRARLGGSDRYATAAKIAEWQGVSDALVITTGLDFPDALAGGAGFGRDGVPILLTHPTLLSPAAKRVLEVHGPDLEQVFFLGGASAVSVPVRTAVRKTIRDTWNGPRSISALVEPTAPVVGMLKEDRAQ